MMKRNIFTLSAVLTATLTLSSITSAKEQTTGLSNESRSQTRDAAAKNADDNVNQLQFTKQRITNSQAKSILVGTWRASIFEYDQRFEILWVIKPNGITYFSFKYPNGNILTKTGRWYYSGNIITQIGTDGEISKGSIEFINYNYFVVTILTNSDPGSAGFKRHYYRDIPKN